MRDLERKFQRGGNGQLKTPIPELQPFETEGVCLLPFVLSVRVPFDKPPPDDS